MGSTPSCFTTSNNKRPIIIQNKLKAPLVDLPLYLKRKIAILSDKPIRQEIPLHGSQDIEIKLIQDVDRLNSYRDVTYNTILFILVAQKLVNITKAVPVHYFSQVLLVSIGQLYQESLSEQVKKCQKIFDFRFQGFIKCELNNLAQVINKYKISKNLYSCLHDSALINRANMSLNLYSSSLHQQSLELFKKLIDFIETKEESKNQFLLQLEKAIKVGKFLGKKVLQGDQLLIKVINLINQIKHPAYYPYTNLVMYEMSTYIKLKYHQNKIKYRGKRYFFVLQLSKIQMQQISTLSEQHITFPIFILGYTNQEQAKAQMKNNPKKYLFSVDISTKIGQYATVSDFGFIEQNSRVLFNIRNFYKVQKIAKEQISRQINLSYGSLAEEMNKRATTFRYSKFATKKDLRCLKLWDFFILQRQFVTTQMDLLYCLQMYKEFIDEANKELGITKNTIDATIHGAKDMNSSIVLQPSSIAPLRSKSYQLNQRLGDAQCKLGNKDGAELYYQGLPNRLRKWMKMLQMYQNDQNNEQLIKAFKEMESEITIDETKERLLQSAYNRYAAIKLMNEGEFKKSKEKLIKSLINLNDIFTIRYAGMVDQDGQSLLPMYQMILKTQRDLALMQGQPWQIYESQMNQSQPLMKGINSVTLLI